MNGINFKVDVTPEALARVEENGRRADHALRREFHSELAAIREIWAKDAKAIEKALDLKVAEQAQTNTRLIAAASVVIAAIALAIKFVGP